jgi:hypothetical protein
MSQRQPNAALFYPDQDGLAIDKLFAFGTGLGIVTTRGEVLLRPHKRLTTKTRLREQFISSQAFHRTLGERVRETAAGE